MLTETQCSDSRRTRLLWVGIYLEGSEVDLISSLTATATLYHAKL